MDFSFRIISNFDKCLESLMFFIRLECDEPLSTGRRVAPVITLPINLVFDNSDEDMNLAQCDDHLLSLSAKNIEAQCIREFRYGSNNKNVAQDLLFRGCFWAFECPGYLGIGGKVWDSCYVLLNYLKDNKSLIEGHAILELGSGTGLAGLNYILLIFLFFTVFGRNRFGSVEAQISCFI